MYETETPMEGVSKAVAEVRELLRPGGLEVGQRWSDGQGTVVEITRVDPRWVRKPCVRYDLRGFEWGYGTIEGFRKCFPIPVPAPVRPTIWSRLLEE